MTQLNRRNFLEASSAIAAGVFVGPSTAINPRSTLDSVNLGYISCGGRANQLMGQFGNVEGINVAGVCDPDESKVAKAKKRFPKATGYADLRKLLDSKDVDAVVISTCNHWHCLAAIWAMEAGKDVYVEKPLSHSQWEGRQTVAAAREHGRVCQLGTQQRSDPMQAQIKQFLHEEKALGAIKTARVNRYGVRGSIGKRATPLKVQNEVNYDMWLGPAKDEPIYRDKLHYDWHWDWNTGSGEMGNWGVHVLDDLRNNIFQDKVTLPKRIMGGGGRVVWNDAGDTPNVHFVYFDTGSIPVVIGLTNLTAGTGKKKSPNRPGPNSGYVAYCEGGRFEGQRGSGVAYDSNGKVVKRFKGNRGDVVHQQNFIDAVRAGNPAMLNAEVKIGNDSTGWCNLANIAFQAGSPGGTREKVAGDQGIWPGLVGEMAEHLSNHGIAISSKQISLSPMLEIDVENEKFVGENAEVANKLLKREYRARYVVPTYV
jgi:predicted dehydrogenase